MNKEELRSLMQDKRSSLGEMRRLRKGDLIFDKIYKSRVYKDAKTIMTFVSFRDEIDTHTFIKKAIKDNKKIVVPITFAKEKIMKVSHLKDFSELELGFYNILTPKKDFQRFINPKEIDLALIPGLAFDKNGYRIGYGGGYYDRFLIDLRPDSLKLGIGFDFQFIDRVPSESYDVPIDILLTDKKVISFTNKEF